MKPETKKPIPQPGEVWLHNSAGTVKIVRRWNEGESVCETDSGRRRLLRDELMIGRVVVDATEGAIVLEKVNGERMVLARDEATPNELRSARPLAEGSPDVR